MQCASLPWLTWEKSSQLNSYQKVRCMLCCHLRISIQSLQLNGSWWWMFDKVNRAQRYSYQHISHLRNWCMDGRPLHTMSHAKKYGCSVRDVTQLFYTIIMKPLILCYGRHDCLRFETSSRNDPYLAHWGRNWMAVPAKSQSFHWLTMVTSLHQATYRPLDELHISHFLLGLHKQAVKADVWSHVTIA